MRKKAYMLGREMIWSHVAHLYMESFARARRSRQDVPYKPLAVRTLAEQPMDLPGWRLDHLVRMTDSTGLLQHARSTIPHFAEGYCTDDNARGLVLTVLLEQLGQGSGQVHRLATIYAAFLNLRVRPGAGPVPQLPGLRPPMARGGRLRRQPRPFAAGPGACVSRSRRRDLQFWASRLFDQALPAIGETTSPRGWATAVIGICLYLQRFGGARPASQMRDALADRLIELFDRTADDDWTWFEDILTLRQRQAAARPDRRRPIGREPEGHRRRAPGPAMAGRAAEGAVGLLPPHRLQRLLSRGGERAQFDQQPLEAQATISACIEAYHATEDPAWLREARLAFEWFLGGNDLGLDLYDAKSGGCCDGLQEDRVNLNQGAESTLAFLLSLGEMKLMESTPASLRQAQVT